MEQYHDGKCVLSFYGSCGYLNQSMRNKLSSVIIKDRIQKTITLDKVQFMELAKGIIYLKFQITLKGSIWYYISYLSYYSIYYISFFNYVVINCLEVKKDH